ncbi:MAG: retropepsin-like aspartic protease [Rhizobacter sp.]
MANDFPRTLKIATVWLLVGVVVFVGFQMFEQHQHETRFTAVGEVIEIRRAGDGHYHWPGSINGRAVDFLIDTGSTGSALSGDMARELKLEAQGNVKSSTAGGIVTGRRVSADVVLRGGVTAERLNMTALDGLNNDQPLLGMDVLGRLQWQQREGVLTIDLRSMR